MRVAGCSRDRNAGFQALITHLSNILSLVCAKYLAKHAKKNMKTCVLPAAQYRQCGSVDLVMSAVLYRCVRKNNYISVYSPYHIIMIAIMCASNTLTVQR